MPRTQPQEQLSAPAPATVVDGAKSEFLRIQPLLKELKAKMKELKQQQKEAAAVLHQHMDEKDLTSLEVGQFTFQKKEVEKCPFNEKKFTEFVEGNQEGQGLLELYKEKFTESATSYRVKKARENDED
jgi:hypothetical protein